MLGHLRTEAYRYMNRPRFPGQGNGAVSIASNEARIAGAKGSSLTSPRSS